MTKTFDNQNTSASNDPHKYVVNDLQKDTSSFIQNDASATDPARSAVNDLQACAADYPERKRKAMESAEEADVAAQKRKKNRDAASRCRQKKDKRIQDLQQKFEELQKENCELARQRNDIAEILRWHQAQGCTIMKPAPFCWSSNADNVPDPHSLVNNNHGPSTLDLNIRARSNNLDPHIIDPNIRLSNTLDRPNPLPPIAASGACPGPLASETFDQQAIASQQTYQVDSETTPLKRNFGGGGTTATVGGDSSCSSVRGHLMAMEHDSQAETKEMIMRIESATSTPSPTYRQKPAPSVQERAPQHWNESEPPLKMYLPSCEAHMEGGTKAKNSASVNHLLSSTATSFSFSQRQQALPALSPRQEVMYEQVYNYDIDHSVKSHDNAQLQDNQQNDMYISESDMYLSDDGLKSALKQFDEKIFDELEATQDRVDTPMTDTITATSSDDKVSSSQISSDDGGKLTYIVADQTTTWALDSTSEQPSRRTLGDLASHETAGDRIMQAQTGQASLYTASPADSASPCLSRKIAGTMPVLPPMDEPQFRLSVPPRSRFGELSESDQTFSDSITSMKNVKLRPRAQQLIATASSSGSKGFRIVNDQQTMVSPQQTVSSLQMTSPRHVVSEQCTAKSVRSTQNEETSTCATTDSSHPLQDSRIIKPLSAVGFQQAPLDRLSISIWDDEWSLLQIQQQQAPPTSVAPVQQQQDHQRQARHMSMAPVQQQQVQQKQECLTLVTPVHQQVPQQQVLLSPLVPVSQRSTPQVAQSLAVQGKPQCLGAGIQNGVLDTNSTRVIREYLQLNAIEVLNIA